jgi:hypothetical protein
MVSSDRHLMWGYQTYFHFSLKQTAEGVFALLDSDLDPQVFLIGFRAEPQPDAPPICVEPEECSYACDILAGVPATVMTPVPTDRESDSPAIFVPAGEPPRWMMGHALSCAVEEALERQAGGRRHFVCSSPTRVAGYDVCVVLHLRKDVYQSYYRLKRDQTDQWRIFTSLIDAVVDELFSACAAALARPESSTDWGALNREADEIVRAAGDRLMYTPAYAAGSFDGTVGLFRAYTTISSLPHEGSDCQGAMLVARRDHPNIDPLVTFTTPVLLRNFRAVRKLLQMSTPDLYLLSDSTTIYGLGRLGAGYDAGPEDLFVVNFVRHHTWELMHAGRRLMIVSYGQPQLPRRVLKREEFRSCLQRLFGRTDEATVDNLLALALTATTQKHGTTLVISAIAKQEAERLGGQSIPISPIKMTPDLLRSLSSIDGAVLLDPEGTCHGVGVILDGLVSEKGDPSRGARYNSAVRYLEGQRHPCLIVIVSEDGFVGVIPELKPVIPRADIDRVVGELRDMADGRTLDRGRYNRAMGWLRQHEFYLLRPVCDEVNTLKRRIESCLSEGRGPTSRHPSPDFIPHEDMDESYFFDELAS